MNEYLVLWTAVGGLFGVITASALYSLGGRNGKWKRRWIAAFILAVSVCVCSVIMKAWSAWQLLVFPVLVAGFHMGYGADTEGVKYIRRAVYGISNSLAGVVMYLTIPHHSNAYWLLILQVLGVVASVILGVKNPLYASAEEVFVCVYLNIALLGFPFVG